MAVVVDNKMEHESQASVEDAFDFVANCENDPTWCAWVLSSKQLKGNGPGKGAVYEIEQALGPETVVRAEVLLSEFERPRKLSWESETEAYSYRCTMEFHATANGTRIVQHNQATFHGMPEEATDEMRAATRANGMGQFEKLEQLLTAN